MKVPFVFFLVLAFASFLFPSLIPSAGWRMAEICDNATDDDGDGLIDLNDPDCDCPLSEPESLIPNPSFEDMECCPEYRSQLFCADSWIQASEATTDYLHSCGWMGWANLPPPLPLPDGEACVGFRNGRFRMENRPNWKEYAGACLLAPLRANIAYRFRFNVGFTHFQYSPPIDVTFFGSTSCENLPFGIGDPDYGCPTNGPGWQFLGSVRANGIFTWVSREISITPNQDIYAIAIGPDCSEKTAPSDLYYFFDNLILAEQSAFEFQISTNGHPCSDAFFLQIAHRDTLSYQWYKDGIALPGQTSHRLSALSGNGDYQVRMTGSTGCTLSTAYHYQRPWNLTSDKRTICENETYAFKDQILSRPGIYVDTFENVNGCDSIVFLDLEVVSSGADSVSVKIFEGESYRLGTQTYDRPGEYLSVLQSVHGCDSLVFLSLEIYQVFIPNAFSPNDDGINDRFIIYGGPDLVTIRSLRVFDRWGGLTYEGEDLPPGSYSAGWDGKTSGHTSTNGIYTFMAVLEMDDGQERLLSGSVLLIR